MQLDTSILLTVLDSFLVALRKGSKHLSNVKLITDQHPV